MDYRKFLAKREELVLPYFGGARVEAESRRLRVEGDLDRGWWRFAIERRNARGIEPAEPGDLSGRPAVRGHYACGWLFAGGREVERLALPPADEPEPLAPCVGRRWFGGEVLLEAVEFEDEAEGEARLALETGAAIDAVKGVSPGLRAAFGFAVIDATGADLGIAVSPREAAAHVLDIAARGRPAAVELVNRIEEERQRHLRAVAARRRDELLVDAAQSARPIRANRSRQRGADRALEAAGARMLRCRSLGSQLEVTFSFMGERFISVVDAETLNVADAGICLSGADRELTLDSLPSAIREAIETGALCITRR